MPGPSRSSTSTRAAREATTVQPRVCGCKAVCRIPGLVVSARTYYNHAKHRLQEVSETNSAGTSTSSPGFYNSHRTGEESDRGMLSLSLLISQLKSLQEDSSDSDDDSMGSTRSQSPGGEDPFQNYPQQVQ